MRHLLKTELKTKLKPNAAKTWFDKEWKAIFGAINEIDKRQFAIYLEKIQKRFWGKDKESYDVEADMQMKMYGVKPGMKVPKALIYEKMKIDLAYTKYFETFGSHNWNNRAIIYKENVQCTNCSKSDIDCLYLIHVFTEEQMRYCMKCVSPKTGEAS